MATVNINSITSSLVFLMSSMVDTGRQVMMETFGMQKPSWLSQTERFESFFSQLSSEQSAVDNFSEKFIIPLFKTNELSIPGKTIDQNFNVNNWKEYNLLSGPELKKADFNNFFN